VRGRVGERVDDVQHLDDRAGPAVRDQERERVLVLRRDMDEVDVETVNLGHELWQATQPRLQPPEVVLGLPVACECLDRRELDALRQVVDGLLLGQARRRDARTQRLNFRFRGDRDREWPDRCGARCAFGGDRHVGLLSSFGLVVDAELAAQDGAGPSGAVRRVADDLMRSPFNGWYCLTLALRAGASRR